MRGVQWQVTYMHSLETLQSRLLSSVFGGAAAGTVGPFEPPDPSANTLPTCSTFTSVFTYFVSTERCDSSWSMTPLATRNTDSPPSPAPSTASDIRCFTIAPYTTDFWPCFSGGTVSDKPVVISVSSSRVNPGSFLHTSCFSVSKSILITRILCETNYTMKQLGNKQLHSQESELTTKYNVTSPPSTCTCQQKTRSKSPMVHTISKLTTINLSTLSQLNTMISNGWAPTVIHRNWPRLTYPPTYSLTW